MPAPGLRRPSRRGLAAASLALFLTGCGLEELIWQPLEGRTPHERYVEYLRHAWSVETVQAREWIRTSEEELEAAILAMAPMIEEGWLPREYPAARGYRLDMQKGQRLRVQLDLDVEEGAPVFMDVFRKRERAEEDEPGFFPVAWADPFERELVFDADTTATFLFRVQPGLLQGGAYRLAFEVGPSLVFPVAGGSARDIRSLYGQPRDGGAREHQGVDIFAPRGTPVVAASEGRVTQVQTTAIGGNVVWVHNEERDHSEYYAHLDVHLVEAGAWVVPGDTLGLVGNSGNAATTAPHLHFGVYTARTVDVFPTAGPVDPFPYLDDPGGLPTPLGIPSDRMDTMTRLDARGATVHAGPTARSEAIQKADPHAPVQILAGSGDWARIRLPDRRQGFVRADRLESLELAEGVVSGRTD